MRPDRFFLSTLATSAAALMCLTSAMTEDAPEVGKETASMKYRAVEDWDYVLPDERWTAITGEIRLPYVTEEGFATEVVGELAMMVDTDADGKLDEKAKGQRSFLKLRAERDGEVVNHAVRIIKDGSWKFQSSCVMTGKVAGTTVRLIDQNNNGSYDDFGQDAMVIGSGKAATPLSRVINVDGDLYDFEVNGTGTLVTYSPYQGETATVDLSSKYEARGKLVAAVLANRQDNVYFNPARSKTPMKVPVGDYKLTSGFAERSSESVKIRTGKMRPIELAARDEFVLEWGGPVVAEFDYAVKGDTITVQPNVAFYGNAGEEYHSFKPDAKSPKIVVLDKQTRKEVASGRFGGC